MASWLSKFDDGEPSDVRVYNRFYLTFDEGELQELVCEAAEEGGLVLSPDDSTSRKTGALTVFRMAGRSRTFYKELKLSIG